MAKAGDSAVVVSQLRDGKLVLRSLTSSRGAEVSSRKLWSGIYYRKLDSVADRLDVDLLDGGESEVMAEVLIGPGLWFDRVIIDVGK